MNHCIYGGVTGYIFFLNIVFLSLKFDFVLANSADPDEKPHYAAFDLDFHCLPKYMCRDFLYTRC